MSASQPAPASEPADLVLAKLDALASVLAPGGARATGLRRLTGGASLETWAFDIEGESDLRPLILRRRGGGGEAEVFETSLALPVEARLLKAAEEGGVAVARLVRDCGEADGLGEAYVVERVSGETLGRRIAADPAFAPAREILGRQCGEALARIHAIHPPGLPPLEVQDGRAVLDRYADIYRRSSNPRPVMEAALKWMEARLPAPVQPRLVHGDFRNGNLMVDPDQGLTAVLDWELAHLGDPAEDLGWLCVNSWRFGVTDRVVGGFADLEVLLDAYRAAGGEPWSVERVRFWQAVGTFKWAVVTMMMYRTFASGASRSVERAVIGRRLSECEVDLLALMEASR
ncbi:MAG: phosphotransferase family protein [Candidatus Brevundimonas phytovorans]|nr:phosphotransferase family protein [Brevundimonas sp.]WEK57975.1 MAG: phosphotransferase family protein [Brevundimonas sp.]